MGDKTMKLFEDYYTSNPPKGTNPAAGKIVPSDDPRAFAQDPEKLDRMLKAFEVAESNDELTQLSMLYVFDMTYDRGDVLLAIKLTQQERGWSNA
jgi:hypothetical protein